MSKSKAKAKVAPQSATTPSPFARGSQWRRWDLHIHTPESALNNQFGSWDEYVGALEAAPPEVRVVGITDYMTLEGYKRVVDQRSKGRLANFDLILPNIEFRCTPLLESGRALNVHLLISTDDPEHIARIEEALRLLTLTVNGEKYSCAKESLTRLGKIQEPAIKEDGAALRVGIEQFKPSLDAFMEWYRGSAWLKTNALIVVPTGTDGIGGMKKGGFEIVRKEAARAAHLVFSGNPSERKYFLGEGTDSVDVLREKYGGPRACIHGSDAHAIKDLFRPDQDRYCWIKGDPTFAGLKQLLYEPKDRVWIGKTPPGSSDQSKVIDRVQFEGCDHWFENTELHLNDGLVTVIGEKGHGKTALADAIAHACGAWNEEHSSTSFLSKAEKYLGNTRATVHWADGRTSEADLDSHEEGRPELVRYLSQDYVEHLCSADYGGEALVRVIQEVIFNHLPDEDRLGASNFTDLYEARVEHIQTQKIQTLGKLHKLNREITALEENIASKPDKVKRLEKLSEEIAAIDNQLPALQANADQQVLESLEKKRASLEAVKKEVAKVNKAIQKLNSAQSGYKTFVSNVETEFEKIVDLMEEGGIASQDIDTIRPKLVPHPLKMIEEAVEKLQKSKAALSGLPEAPVMEPLNAAFLEKEVKELETRVTADTQVKEKITELQTQKKKLKKEQESLTAEISNLDSKAISDLAQKDEARFGAYREYFLTLQEEKKVLQTLYSPVSTVTTPTLDGNDIRASFEFTVRPTIGLDGWMEQGRSLVDRRRASQLKDEAEFTRVVRNAIEKAWNSLDPDAAIESIKKLRDDLEIPKAVPTFLGNQISRPQFYDWFYSPEHIQLKYSIQYDGTELEYLSPGTRGIVLLILYLKLDDADRRPLLIDQPEANLDNASIFEALVPFIRAAKIKRQVIVVTHNPNLVVSTDAEQVVIASARKPADQDHPKITYRSGSLECSGSPDSIRSRVCRLLEGGEQAFRVREAKYGFPT